MAEYDGIAEDVFVQGIVTASTTAIEVKVGASPDKDRQYLRIYNDGSQTVYLGPDNTVTSSGATKGEPLLKKQWIEYPISECLTIWAITNSSTSDLIVSEIG